MDVRDIPMKEIYVDYNMNSRGKVVPFDVLELVADLEVNALQSPVSVTNYVNAVKPELKWQLLFGFRRHKAFEILKRETIPAIVLENVGESEKRRINLTENINREDLTPVQEANALKYFFDLGWTDDSIANTFNQTRNWVEKRRLILKLPENVQKLIAAGVIEEAHIGRLKRLSTDQMYQLVRDIRDSKFKLEQLGVKGKRTNGPKINKRYLVKDIIPTDTELEKLKIAIYDSLGPGIATRLLGYAQGYVTGIDIWKDVLSWCQTEARPLLVTDPSIAHMLGIEPQETDKV